MDLSQYAELFLAESKEHLSACNQLLLEWERNPQAPEPVSGIFRAVHTIKGMAATMGYVRVADLAHRMENLLDRQRRGSVPATDALLQLLFRSTDALEQAIDLSVTGKEREADLTAVLAELDAAASRVTVAVPAPRVPKGGRKTPEPAESPVESVAAPSPIPQPPAPPAATTGRLVEVTLRAEAALKGGRAMIVLARARTLGNVAAVTPPPTAFEAEEFDGRFSFRLESPAEPAAIERAVLGAGDVERVAISDDGVREAADAGRARHIRVDQRRLDSLMDLIGELVTARGRLNDLAARLRDPEVGDVALQVSRLSADLQSEIIQARMTPVWQVFDRFPRLVRDVARELDKDVVFRVEGKEIELDRAILDELGDPLVHLLRNAVDHGIESAAARRTAGKKAEGEVVLAAVRERASVTITIADDGRGIDRARILAKAKVGSPGTELEFAL